jgi:hypothetical protein
VWFRQQALAGMTTITVFGPDAKPALLDRLAKSTVGGDQRLTAKTFIEHICKPGVTAGPSKRASVSASASASASGRGGGGNADGPSAASLMKTTEWRQATDKSSGKKYWCVYTVIYYYLHMGKRIARLRGRVHRRIHNVGNLLSEWCVRAPVGFA